MMGWSPRCYIPSFVEIGPRVPEMKISEGFFTIYGRGGHLGHVTQMPRTKYRSYKIWFRMAKQFLRKLGFNFVRTRPWVKVKK